MNEPDELNDPATAEKKFHVWRLLGVIGLVIATFAVIAFLVDLIVIGPLRGRLY